jgi:hypothetical protein
MSCRHDASDAIIANLLHVLHSAGLLGVFSADSELVEQTLTKIGGSHHIIPCTAHGL